jgi:predicted acyl esterase
VSGKTERRYWCWAVCICLAAPGLLQARDAAPTKQTIMVPMRDGIKLATDIYLPKGDGPWPAVVTRTPYNKNSPLGQGAAAHLTKAGYVVVAQDVRGRNASEGVNVPFENDMEDGYDTVEWVASSARRRWGSRPTSRPPRPRPT